LRKEGKMDNLLIYLFKVSIGTTLLYICYLLFFSKDTFYIRNRILLILILLLPAILPAIKIPIVSESSFATDTVESLDNILLPVASSGVNITGIATGAFDFFRLFVWIYLTISGLFLLRCVISVIVTLRIIKRGAVRNNQFPKIVITDLKLSPFSFFPYIVIPAEYDKSENYNDVLNHETAHVRQGHTFDLLLSEILIAVQWFNPFVWLIKRSIILNHEYLADHVSISRLIDIKEYQVRLLRFDTGLKAIQLAHNFNSVVKNRIIMINKKPSPRFSTMKNLIILPVVALVTYTSATPEYKYASPSVSKVIEQEHNNQAKGIVLGEDGKPLMLVTIVMRSNTPENIGVQTGSDGHFIINNLVKDATLEFSCIGYKTQILKPDFAADMVVKMVKDPNYKMSVRTSDASFYHEGSNVRIVLIQNKDAIIVIDDKITSNKGEITLNRDDIAASKLLKGVEAIDKYGEIGKNGVLEIVSKKHAAEIGLKTPELQMSSNSPGDAPTFQGKDRTFFREWVAKHTNYPAEAYQKGIEGWVSVNFTVNPDGSVSNVTSVSGDQLLSEEVIRVVKSSKWDPVKNESNAKPFDSNITLKFSSGTKSGRAPAFQVQNVDEPLNRVDEMPEYPGGENALLDFIKKNIKYPKEALTKKLEGKVIVRFIVTKEGKSEAISVLKGINPAIDAEAIRVIGLIKNWEPGKLNGKVVNVWYMIPVTFELPKPTK
jgi:TonB family protein